MPSTSSPPPPSPQDPNSPRSSSSSPIFSASRSPSPSLANLDSTRRPEPSDLPHLIRTHETLGYRAGVADGKDAAAGVQAAFDEGYPLGAELGFRVGWLLAVIAAQGADADRREKLDEAERELSIASLIAEMEASGMLGSRDIVTDEGDAAVEGSLSHATAVGGWNAPTDFVDTLPSIRKWAIYADGILNQRSAM